MSTAAGIIAVFMLSPTVYTYARSPHAHHLPTLNVHTRLSSHDQIDVTGAKRIHGRPVLSLPERLPHLRVLIVKEVSFFFNSHTIITSKHMFPGILFSFV